MTSREVGVVAGVLAAVVSLALVASNGGVLLTRPLWVDEVHTVLVTDRASPVAMVRDLAAGADFGPPLVYFAAWTLRQVAGPLTPVLLRSASLLCVFGALLLTYLVLRRRFEPGASLAGILAVGTQGLVIAHSYEARFYAPWLFCIACFAWALTSPHKRVRLAVAAAALSTVHWYGVIVLTLMVAGVVVARHREWRKALRDLWPAGAGPIALAFCLPLAFGQRAALSVATWVPDFTFTQFSVLLSSLWAGPVQLAALAAFAFGHAVRKERIGSDVGVAALLALAFVPLVLASLSMVGQPSMLPRYSIATHFALAPLVAFGAQVIGRVPQRVALAAIVWLWLPGYAREARRKRTFEAAVVQSVESYRRAATIGGPVVFSSMHVLYAVAAAGNQNRDSLTFLEIDDSTTSALMTKGALVERDVVRIHARRFGFPRLSSQADLRKAARFSIVGLEPNLGADRSAAADYARVAFPAHCLDTATAGVTGFVLRGSVAKC